MGHAMVDIHAALSVNEDQLNLRGYARKHVSIPSISRATDADNNLYSLLVIERLVVNCYHLSR